VYVFTSNMCVYVFTSNIKLNSLDTGLAKPGPLQAGPSGVKAARSA